MAGFRELILRNIPTPLLKWYFQKRGFVEQIRSEILPDFFFDISINSNNSLWRDRLTNVNGHEPEICEFFRKNLKESEVLYDVGSHFGFFPALASTISSSASIHCFQPHIYMSYFLKINMHNYRHINSWYLIEKFVSDNDDRKHVSLDKYAERTGEWPSLIKIDIDGPEVFALKGCTQILKERKTRFLLEVHPELMQENFSHTWDDIFNLIPSDYLVKYLPNVREIASWSDSFESVKNDDNPYIYFCPKELDIDKF